MPDDIALLSLLAYLVDYKITSSGIDFRVREPTHSLKRGPRYRLPIHICEPEDASRDLVDVFPDYVELGRLTFGKDKRFPNRVVLIRDLSDRTVPVEHTIWVSLSAFIRINFGQGNRARDMILANLKS